MAQLRASAGHKGRAVALASNVAYGSELVRQHYQPVHMVPPLVSFRLRSALSLQLTHTTPYAPSPCFLQTCMSPQYLTFADFWPMMECVLRYHPGLEFLAETQEFQRKYAETVIHRIFYSLNK